VKSIRIAHIADTHLGYRALGKIDPGSGRNQRTVDVEQAFEFAITDILNRDVDLVLHSGDMFHQTRPPYASIGCGLCQLRRLEEVGIPTVVIGGNHDTPRLRASGSVFSLLQMAAPAIHFCGGYTEEFLPFPDLDLVVTAIPHGRLTEPLPPAVFPVSGKRNILVTHGFVPNMELLTHRNEPGEEEVGEELLLRDFDYIALGHYHIRSQVRPNAWYAGSTERFGWGDEPVQPGYLIVELDPSGELRSVEAVDVPARPLFTLRPPERETDGLDSRALADIVLKWLESLQSPEALTRVVLFNVPRPVRRQAESILKDEAEPLVWSVQVFGQHDILAGFRDQQSDLPAIDLRALFAQFVETERESGRHDPAFSQEFSRIGLEELEGAIAQVEAEIADEEPAA
jgi:DNA repair protein SbcD/Mre11